MRVRAALAALAALAAGGCGTLREKWTVPAPTPAVSREEILGLRPPAALVQDPETGHFAHPEVLEAYRALRARAREEGFELVLVSAWRSFAAQKAIWNRKWEALAATQPDPEARLRAIGSYTALPGTSRHHWGTDLDLSEGSIRRGMLVGEEEAGERLLRFFRWLEREAPRYGFCLVYRGGQGLIGREPWHWSYTALAAPYEAAAVVPDAGLLREQGVKGLEVLHGALPDLTEEQRRSVHAECRAFIDGSSAGP